MKNQYMTDIHGRLVRFEWEEWTPGGWRCHEFPEYDRPKPFDPNNCTIKELINQLKGMPTNKRHTLDHVCPVDIWRCKVADTYELMQLSGRREE